MNRDLPVSMQKRLAPSPAARAALEERLAQRGRHVPRGRYAALAVCGMLVLAALPLLHMIRPAADSAPASALHSYVVLDDHIPEAEDTSAAGNGKADSWPVPSANGSSAAGESPSGAVTEDVPVQEDAVSAYQNLMTRFWTDYGPDTYPDWYGGAYIDEDANCLVVNIVEAYDSEDKALPLQIADWAGSSRVGFGSVHYSLTHLRHLQKRACDAMDKLGLVAGCGVNEEAGRVELTLSSITPEALRLLAELDPADDAILVQVGQPAQAQDGPAVSRSIQSGGAEGEQQSGDSRIAVERTVPLVDGDQRVFWIIRPLEPASLNGAPHYDLLTP